MCGAGEELDLKSQMPVRMGGVCTGSLYLCLR